MESGVSDGIQSRLGEFIGVGKEDLPQLRIINPSETMLKYNYEGAVSGLSSEAVGKFVSDFKAGTLQPHLKSDPIPENSTVDGLTVVVGKSFDSIVLSSLLTSIG